MARTFIKGPQIAEVIRLLNEHINKETKLYDSGWSDKRIADIVGGVCNPDHVAYRREEMGFLGPRAVAKKLKEAAPQGVLMPVSDIGKVYARLMRLEERFNGLEKTVNRIHGMMEAICKGYGIDVSAIFVQARDETRHPTFAGHATSGQNT